MQIVWFKKLGKAGVKASFYADAPTPISFFVDGFLANRFGGRAEECC